MQKITTKIEGMSCQHCVMRVKKAIDSLPGISDSEVTIGSAVVKFDEIKLRKEDIEAAIEKVGYKPVK
ncbi:MAG: heavy-metal-associated domain-containing protein [Chloroflexota bacterium]